MDDLYKEGKRGIIEWHDLILAPYDLPEVNEQILVTVETISEERKVCTDIYLGKTPNDNHFWWRYVISPEGVLEKTSVWEEIIAWAYLPNPYSIQREII